MKIDGGSVDADVIAIKDHHKSKKCMQRAIHNDYEHCKVKSIP